MSASQTKPLLLLTGATGYIGFRVLLSALEAGWTVRAAVRSISSAKSKLLSTPTISSSPSLSSRLTFVEVPDILAPGAYAQAVADVTHIIHCASPLSSANVTDYEAELIAPAVQGTLEILRAAASASTPTVQRIVITSSVIANMVPSQGPDIVTTAATRIPHRPKGPFDNGFAAYGASKIAALNEAEAWVAREKPAFDVVHVHPAFVLGANELATTTTELATGTAAAGIAHLVIPDSPRAGPLPGIAIDVRDVAFVHVAALDKEKIPGNRSYGVSQPVVWGDAFEIVKRRFPEAVENRIFAEKERNTPTVNWDARETEEVFGFTFKPFEESVVGVAGQWIELVSKKQGGGL